MRFSAREDLAVPAETVFAELSDFAAFERLALRRGAEVVRLDDRAVPQVGLRWAISGRLRGRMRQAECELMRYSPPEAMAFTLRGGGYEAELAITVVALARGRSRILADLDLRARSLGARIALQTVRFGRANLLGRYRAGWRSYALKLELQHAVRRA